METFLVRIWIPSDASPHDERLRGFLDHPRSEESWRFIGADDLCRQLEAAIARTIDLRDLFQERRRSQALDNGPQ